MSNVTAALVKSTKSVMANKSPLVISVVGLPSSGKDTVAEYLVEKKGFVHMNSSDMIRKDMQTSGMEPTRTNMQDFVVKRREERGAGYLAEEIADAIHSNTVASGFRNTAEIEILKKRFQKNFILIAVTVPIETRYQWAKARKRIGDDISFEKFQEEENRDRSNSNFHELDKVITMADVSITNDGTKEKLFAQVDAIIQKLNS